MKCPVLQVINASWCRANGTLVMMVLNKGSMVALDSRNDYRQQRGGSLVASCRCFNVVWSVWFLQRKKKRKRNTKFAAREIWLCMPVPRKLRVGWLLFCRLHRLQRWRHSQHDGLCRASHAFCSTKVRQGWGRCRGRPATVCLTLGAQDLSFSRLNWFENTFLKKNNPKFLSSSQQLRVLFLKNTSYIPNLSHRQFDRKTCRVPLYAFRTKPRKKKKKDTSLHPSLHVVIRYSPKEPPERL